MVGVVAGERGQRVRGQVDESRVDGAQLAHDVGRADVEHQGVGSVGAGQVAGAHPEGQREGSLGSEGVGELDHVGEPCQRAAGDDNLAPRDERAHERAVMVDIHGRRRQGRRELQTREPAAAENANTNAMPMNQALTSRRTVRKPIWLPMSS